jgi:hypothetical protein
MAIKDDLGTVVTDAGASFWSSRGLLALTAIRVGFAF